MSRSYLSGAASPLATPQHEPIPGTTQAENAAGGFAWKIGTMDRLRRFLILGSEGGSYYATPRKLTRENAQAVLRCLAEDGARAVATIVAVSEDGRAPKEATPRQAAESVRTVLAEIRSAETGRTVKL